MAPRRLAHGSTNLSLNATHSELEMRARELNAPLTRPSIMRITPRVPERASCRRVIVMAAGLLTVCTSCSAPRTEATDARPEQTAIGNTGPATPGFLNDCIADPSLEIANDADQLARDFQVGATDAIAAACVNDALERQIASVGLVAGPSFGGLWLNRDEPRASITIAVVEGTSPDTVEDMRQTLPSWADVLIVERPFSLKEGQRLFAELMADVEDLVIIGGAYDPRSATFEIEIGTEASGELETQVADRAAALLGDAPFRISRLDSVEGLG